MRLLKSRGIGFAPDSSHFVMIFFKKKRLADIELAYEAGLLSRNEENFSYYDGFRNRIMFPLKNAQGKNCWIFRVEHIPVKNQNT